jgi:hypothetical protein
MKNLVLVLLTFFLYGCSTQYQMKLNNGTTLSVPGKPKLKGSNYYWKDAKGGEQMISQSRVLEIQPESMAKEENQFKVSEPKKKHWYWPF